jgi:hypothetical protein
MVSYNANPMSNRVEDCTVRAISKALNQSWERTYIGLCLEGFIACDMPHANHVWGNYLKNHGFCRSIIPNEYPDCYTVRNFCEEHPEGNFVLSLSGHVVAVVDGEYYDTWDSGDEIPIYYWYKGEK